MVEPLRVEPLPIVEPEPEVEPLPMVEPVPEVEPLPMVEPVLEVEPLPMVEPLPVEPLPVVELVEPVPVDPEPVVAPVVPLPIVEPPVVLVVLVDIDPVAPELVPGVGTLPGVWATVANDAVTSAAAATEEITNDENFITVFQVEFGKTSSSQLCLPRKLQQNF